MKPEAARSSDAPPAWMTWVLKAAAIYNLAWGTLVVLFPQVPFRWAGMPEPNYPQLWQCIGMIVGVYGIGYWIAAADPRRHWPIVLVGLLGKIFGPIGFLVSALNGSLPWIAGATILTNDLIWWLPFAGILLWVRVEQTTPPADPEFGSFAEALAKSVANTGESLMQISQRQPTLVVFLRHAGCTFCREAAADLASRRQQIEAQGTGIALIHMGTESQGAEFFQPYGLADLPRISDPGRALYRAFDLQRGSLWQILGPTVWWKGFLAGVVRGHGVGKPASDVAQLAGSFLLDRGQIVKAYRHKTSADRTDFSEMAACPVPAPAAR
jgi:peroxiredoxin